jgi:hypothetical protein
MAARVLQVLPGHRFAGNFDDKLIGSSSRRLALENAGRFCLFKVLRTNVGLIGGDLMAFAQSIFSATIATENILISVKSGMNQSVLL